MSISANEEKVLPNPTNQSSAVAEASSFLRTFSLRPDLGIKNYLLPRWKQLFTTKGLTADLLAGATVACVAIPLSLAIALASKVEPGVGLTTAILAGFICAIFGGSALGISGPANAMPVLVAAAVESFGLSGLAVVGIVAGLLQLISGIVGAGRIIRFVPVSVVIGFTAGIGAIILVGQLPRALGLPPPDQAHVFGVIQHIFELFHKAQPVECLLAILTIVLAKSLPRFSPKIPAPLFAVLIPTIIVEVIGLHVPAVGAIPRGLPSIHFPSIPDAAWKDLIGTGFVVFALASLETLLSASALDKMGICERHDPDQELVGQGIANFFVALVGGIPVTGVIARSGLNARAGAKTRRSSIFHSCFLLLSIYFLAPMIERIPIATLSGLLIAVAISMLNPRELIQLWKASKSEAMAGFIAFGVIILFDLIAGIQAGIIAAISVAVIKLGQMKITSEGNKVSPYRLVLSGALTFLSSIKIEQLQQKISEPEAARGIVVDLTKLTAVDASGAILLIEFVSGALRQKVPILIKGLATHLQQEVSRFDDNKVMNAIYVATEAEIRERLISYQPHHRLLSGVENFQREAGGFDQVFAKLSSTQKPHTLFITCSDSRINPNLITSTDPGELFIIRNMGNFIPPFGVDATPAEGAAVEYAVGLLGVQEVIVCGHLGCGAMAAVLSDPKNLSLPSVAGWIKLIREPFGSRVTTLTPDEACKVNVLSQLQNLSSYPIIREKLAEGSVNLRAWIYDLGGAEISEWNESSDAFVPVSPLQRKVRALG